MSTDDFKLVYQPIPPNDSNEVFAGALKEAVGASESVAIASPYLSLGVLEPLVEGRGFRLVTDLDACLEGGADPQLVEFLKAQHQHIRSVRGLHAKVVLGKHAGLFGSANLTTTGLSRRFEMACVVRGSRLEELAAWFDALWIHSKRLDIQALTACPSELAGRERTSKSTVSSLPATGQLGWLTRPATSDLPREGSFGSIDAPPGASDASEQELQVLVTRLRELTLDRATARLVLDMLARALEHAGLLVDDERLHLNCGRPRKISVTLGQRHVAWCRREGEIREFGMMLQSFDTANRAVAAIPGARQRAYTKNKSLVIPELYVPLEALGSLDPSVLLDWERSIRREVQECGRSSYRSKKRVELYNILLNPTLRLTAVSRAYPS